MMNMCVKDQTEGLAPWVTYIISTAFMRGQCCDLVGSDGATIGSSYLETGKHSTLHMGSLDYLNGMVEIGVSLAY